MGKLCANDDIQAEYERWLAEIDRKDVYSDSKTISVVDVLKAHFLIAEYFSEDGKGLGGVGPRDLNLLNSALYRQHVCYGGKCKYEDKFDIVATLLYGLVKDHPFHDANKRTAFLSVLFFLQKLGYVPTVEDKEFEDFLVDVANGLIKEKRRYKEFKEKHDDPEIRYISWYLRTHTRKIDKQQYLITYRELNKILSRYGYELKYPYRNSISLIEHRKKKLYNLFSRSQTTEVTLGKINFPSWTKQVPRGILKKVRDLTQLTDARGIDSQVFFKDAEPLSMLIAKYERPLKRLADR